MSEKDFFFFFLKGGDGGGGRGLKESWIKTGRVLFDLE